MFIKASYFSKSLLHLARYGVNTINVKITRQSIEKGAFTLKKQFPSFVRDAIE